MTSHKGAGALALAAALILVGGGCTMPFGKERPTTPILAEDTMKQDMSGKDLPGQADIVIEAALDEAAFEEGAAGNGEDDASLFTADERELNNLENSYDDSEL